jgi:predicted nucleic acid-binding protein
MTKNCLSIFEQEGLNHVQIPQIYIETSIFNFVFTDDAPDKRQNTLKLFAEIKEGKYEPYTSVYVIQELEQAFEPKREKMLALLGEYNIKVLDANAEAERLADIYVAEGIIPAKYSTDGLHIAMAAIEDLDFIVSLNFKHIVKRKTIEITEIVNYREGYKKIGIYSPAEVIEND